MLPDWLKQSPAAPCSCCDVSVSKKKSYLKKTIWATRKFIVETFLQEKEASKDGLLQGLDVHFKLVTTLILVIILSFTHSLPPLLVVYLMILGLAYLSKLNMRPFILRSVLGVGFFSGLVMLPATLNIFIKGREVIRLTQTIAVTDKGLRFFSVFVMRALTMTTAAALLVLTTKREKLLQALNILRVPAAFNMLISMAYRFMAVLVRVVENLHLAKRSRTVMLNDSRAERKWVLSRMGWTFTKAIHMSDEVTQAMISRGWQGD